MRLQGTQKWMWSFFHSFPDTFLSPSLSSSNYQTFFSAPSPLPSSQRSLCTHLEKTLLLLIPPRNPYLIPYTSWQTDGKSYIWDGIVEKFHFIKQGLSCPLHLPANSLHPSQCFSTALTLFGLILYPWS